MKKIFCFAILLIGLAMLTTSCNDNKGGGETITEQAFNNFFVTVTDLHSGETSTYTGTGYQLRLNFTRGTADLVATNFKIPGVTEYPNLILTDIPFKASSGGWFAIKGTNIIPAATVASVPTFDEISIDLLQRVIEESYMPAVAISGTIDGRYKFFSANPNQYLIGSTVCTPEEGDPTTSTETSYTIGLNPTGGNLTIAINSAKFISGMPAMNIAFKNVPYSIVDNKVEFNVDALTPYIGSDPYPAFPITNLRGSLNFSEGMDLSFDCAPSIPSLNGNKYHVEADLIYLPK